MANSFATAKVISTVLLLALLGAFVSLFFIHIDVSVRVSGVLRPITEKTELKAAINRKIKEIYIKENQTIKQGENRCKQIFLYLDTYPNKGRKTKYLQSKKLGV